MPQCLLSFPLCVHQSCLSMVLKSKRHSSVSCILDLAVGESRVADLLVCIHYHQFDSPYVCNHIMLFNFVPHSYNICCSTDHPAFALYISVRIYFMMLNVKKYNVHYLIASNALRHLIFPLNTCEIHMSWYNCKLLRLQYRAQEEWQRKKKNH